MKYFHPFVGKSRKLALSFDYVHDRYMFLPGYLEKFALWIKFSAYLLGILFFLGVWHLWGVHIVQFGKGLLPQPAPKVTAIAHVQSVQKTGQEYALEQWEHLLASVPIQSLKIAHGIPQHISKSNDLFTPEVHLPLLDMHALQSQSTTFASGFTPSIASQARQVMLSFALGNREFPSRLASEIALLRSLIEFNRVGIQEYLARSPNRTEKIEEYLARAQNLNSASRHTLANISARKILEEEKEGSFQIVANQKEQNVLEALNAFATQKTEQNLDELIVSKRQVVGATAHKGLLSALESGYTSELSRLAQYVNAVEQNKQALITNVSVVPTRGIDLGLIQ